MPPPFESLSIIDRPAVLAGTPAATHLGDFAAGVIKIGLPRADSPPIRAIGPHEEGNKCSITIDLRETQGQEFLVRLGKDAVARIENFHPGTLQGWNLAAERLLAENPRLTMRRLSALGQTRSWRQFAGCDRQPQAVSRATYLTRFPGSEPVGSVFATADSMAGIWGAVSIIPAAYWRDAHGGRGQVLDLALCEPMLRACEGSVAEFRLSGAARERSRKSKPGTWFLPRQLSDLGRCHHGEQRQPVGSPCQRQPAPPPQKVQPTKSSPVLADQRHLPAHRVWIGDEGAKTSRGDGGEFRRALRGARHRAANFRPPDDPGPGLRHSRLVGRRRNRDDGCAPRGLLNLRAGSAPLHRPPGSTSPKYSPGRSRVPMGNRHPGGWRDCAAERPRRSDSCLVKAPDQAGSSWAR